MSYASAEMDRRDFIRSGTGLAAGGLALGGGGLPLLDAAEVQLPVDCWKDFYRKNADGTIECRICPRKCVLKPGERSHCRTRSNENGKLVTYAYANPAVVSVDEMTKFPLSNFRPGAKALTLAVGGCNLRCKYCQNYKESQSQPEKLRTFDLPPYKAVEAAKAKGLDTIAFTYTGPVASLEYVVDVCREAKRENLRTVVGCALYIRSKALRRLCEFTDAFAVTLKGTTDSFYRKVIDGELKPVLSALEKVAQTNCWFELTYLVVPTYNDNLERIGRMCETLVKALGKDVPMHFSRFGPTFQLKNLPEGSEQQMVECIKVAKQAGMNYVYVANLSPHPLSATICHRCGYSLVERLDVRVLKNDVKDGRCPKCKTRIPGVWV